MKEEIIFIEIGYYHPSNANWSYRIWLIIDKTGARLYKETFGGDYRAIKKLEEKGLKVGKMFAGKGSSVQYKWRDIKNLYDIEEYNGINWGKGCLGDNPLDMLK